MCVMWRHIKPHNFIFLIPKENLNGNITLWQPCIEKSLFLGDSNVLCQPPLGSQSCAAFIRHKSCWLLADRVSKAKADPVNPVRLLEEVNFAIKESFRFRNKAELKGESRRQNQRLHCLCTSLTFPAAGGQTLSGSSLLPGNCPSQWFYWMPEKKNTGTSQGSAVICPVSAWAHTPSQTHPSCPHRGNPWLLPSSQGPNTAPGHVPGLGSVWTEIQAFTPPCYWT